jgi:hypothetical protein
LARLDRLLDLLDAARFSGDASARETLWGALGGNAISQGQEATRDALTRLLQEAWAVEDAHPDLEGDGREFLSDLIMMLSVDLNLPADSEAVAIQTLAYRSLATQGHARIADNARWRIYDHVRGVLEGATEAPADRRVDVALHALYAEHEDISAWLADTAPHARPEYPGPTVLWSMVGKQRDALSKVDRWRPIVASRDAGDEALRDTVMTLLPEPREPAWALVDVDRGTASPESLAPVLLLEPGRVVVEPGREKPAVFSAINDELPRAIERIVARDGRGTVLLAGDPVLPAPELSGALRALAMARVAVVEVAVREARVDDEERGVIVALPLYLSLPNDPAPGSRAFADARVRIHLDGRGPRVAVDGQWLSDTPTSGRELKELLSTVHRAYPRERAIGLSLAGNVQHQQLVDVLAVSTGGPDRLFAGIGWLAGQPHVEPGAGKKSSLLDLRASLYGEPAPAPALDQPFPLKKADQDRLEGLAAELTRCLPELEAKPKANGLRLGLAFSEGRLAKVSVPNSVKKARREPIEECVLDIAYGFRLREHRDAIAVGVILKPPR